LSDPKLYTSQVSKLDTWHMLKLSHPGRAFVRPLYLLPWPPNRSNDESCFFIYSTCHNSVDLHTHRPCMPTCGWRVYTGTCTNIFFCFWLLRPIEMGQIFLSISHLSDPSSRKASMLCSCLFTFSWLWL
jgi:hypothetical protein